jgi:hypothetical protein
MMDPTKIAPFDNIDLVMLRNFLTFPSFNSKRGCIARWDRRGGKSVSQLERGTLVEFISLFIPNRHEQGRSFLMEAQNKP